MMTGDDCGILSYSDLHLRPDAARTVIRPFDPSYPEAFASEDHPRVRIIVDHVLSMSGEEVSRNHAETLASLTDRHTNVEALLIRRYEQICERVPEAKDASDDAKLLIGAYFSEEYSFEAAALFNPSMVLHPDQEGLSEGSLRFLLTLRGIGEGHVSSVTFRRGTWSARNGFAIDPVSPRAVSPRIEETDDDGAIVVECVGSRDISETVLFPVAPSQRQGIEDLRLVRFVEENGEIAYLGTYTAFDGRDARTEMLHGRSATRFEMRPLEGDAARYKGMALFPRKIDGRFRMLGRMDSESIWLLESDRLHRWDGGAKLVSPRYPWEFVQMGNCGAPIEIDEGWLVLTHGVGMVRNYCVGACLLDRDDPSKLLARTPVPLLRPSPEERDGYVPNVAYSCGAMASGRTLLLPYGVADNFTGFASCSIDALLAKME